MDSKLKLLEVYKDVENYLREAGTNIFNDDSSHAKNKLISRSICIVLLRKMEAEMLQGRFLELKNDFIRSGARQTEIVDPTIECLERLFRENGFFVYTYIANMMIMLMRRVALGIEYVGDENANTILDLYAEVRKTFYQKDFDKFKNAFEGLVDPGVSIVDFIYIKTHQYLAYHYRYQGPKQHGILTMAKYLKMRFQFNMYGRIDNILISLSLLAVQAIELDLCMLKQARHLISVMHTYINRIETSKDKTVSPAKLELLKQLTVITISLYLAVNLLKSYEHMIYKTEIKEFFDKCEKFKDDEIEEIDLPIRYARNQQEFQTFFQKLCEFKTHINEPALLKIFDAIQASASACSNAPLY